MMFAEKLAIIILSYEEMKHKKLQKIAYYAQAWYYTLYGEELASTRFEAWVHGPVSPSIYFAYRDFGWNTIPKSDFDKMELGTDLKEFFDIIFDTFGDFDENELESMTHNEDPWINAREGLKPWEASNNEISLSSMKQYHDKLKEEYQVE